MPSPITFSTNDFPREKRADAWVQWVCETIIDMEIDPLTDGVFGAAAELYDLGSVGAHFLDLSRHKIQRTGAETSRTGPGQIFIQQVRRAPMRVPAARPRVRSAAR